MDALDEFVGVLDRLATSRGGLIIVPWAWEACDPQSRTIQLLGNHLPRIFDTF